MRLVVAFCMTAALLCPLAPAPVTAAEPPGLWRTGAGGAAEEAPALQTVLRVSELAGLLHEDGLAHGAALDRDMLDGQGGLAWRHQVAGIYSSRRIADHLTRDLQQQLSAPETAQIIRFFDSPLGQRILTRELEARRLMADSAYEERAIGELSDRTQPKDAVFVAVELFIEVNDLVDLNVTGALNANYHFMRSFALQGGGLAPQSEILDNVWADADQVQANVTEWLHAYLLTAYDVLDPEELEAYIAFCRTPAGQALNRELFRSFDTLYQDISRDLGKAAAHAILSEEL